MLWQEVFGRRRLLRGASFEALVSYRDVGPGPSKLSSEASSSFETLCGLLTSCEGPGAQTPDGPGYQELCYWEWGVLHPLGRPWSSASQGLCMPGNQAVRRARLSPKAEELVSSSPGVNSLSPTHYHSQCPTGEFMPLVPETLDSGHCFYQETLDCYELKL